MRLIFASLLALAIALGVIGLAPARVPAFAPGSSRVVAGIQPPVESRVR